MTAPVIVPDTDEHVDLARPWKVIVWDDPINLMSYVAFVFQKLFGFSTSEALEPELSLRTAWRGRELG